MRYVCLNLGTEIIKQSSFAPVLSGFWWALSNPAPVLSGLTYRSTAGQS